MSLTFRVLAISVLLTLGLTSCNNSSSSYHLPQTSADVEKFVARAEEKAGARIDKIAAVPFSETTFDNTLREWNRLGNDLIASFVVLSYLTETDLPSKDAAA